MQVCLCTLERSLVLTVADRSGVWTVYCGKQGCGKSNQKALSAAVELVRLFPILMTCRR